MNYHQNAMVFRLLNLLRCQHHRVIGYPFLVFGPNHFMETWISLTEITSGLTKQQRTIH